MVKNMETAILGFLCVILGLYARNSWNPEPLNLLVMALSREWGNTLPQTNMETHIVPFLKDSSLYRALFGFPC